MANVSFPYMSSYKKIPDYFLTIQNAAVPEKITQKVLAETFEFKGTNDRPIIGILKNLGFINEDGLPTQRYSDYKNKSISRKVLGQGVRACYESLYQKNENFHELSDEVIKGYFESTTGKESGNSTLDLMIKTFQQLKSLSDFDEEIHAIEELPVPENKHSEPPDKKRKDFVLTHTIVVNLPVTTDQKVYDVLFKSLKENLL